MNQVIGGACGASFPRLDPGFRSLIRSCFRYVLLQVDAVETAEIDRKGQAGGNAKTPPRLRSGVILTDDPDHNAGRIAGRSDHLPIDQLLDLLVPNAQSGFSTVVAQPRSELDRDELGSLGGSLVDQIRAGPTLVPLA